MPLLANSSESTEKYKFHPISRESDGLEHNGAQMETRDGHRSRSLIQKSRKILDQMVFNLENMFLKP